MSPACRASAADVAAGAADAAADAGAADAAADAVAAVFRAEPRVAAVFRAEPRVAAVFRAEPRGCCCCCWCCCWRWCCCWCCCWCWCPRAGALRGTSVTQPFTWNPPPLQPSKFSSRHTNPRSPLKIKQKQTNVHPCKTAAARTSGVPAPQHPPASPEASPRDIKKHTKIMQNHATHAKSSKIMSCQNQAMRKIVQNELLLRSVHTCTDWSNSIFFSAKPYKKAILPGHTQVWPGRMRGPPKKTGRVKKEWQVGQDTTADHGRGRGLGAYALLLRADGQLTRAGQHYYFHLGLRPPSNDFNYNQPLIREGSNDSLCLFRGRFPNGLYST